MAAYQLGGYFYSVEYETVFTEVATAEDIASELFLKN